MSGWIEWLLLSAGMIAVGVGFLAFLFNPPLALLAGAIVAGANWIASGRSEE